MPSNPITVAIIKATKMVAPEMGDELINGCPAATQSVKLNLSNRYKAVQVANYGPMNPDLPNTKYWEAKAKQFKATVEEAKTTLCGNCSFFIQTPDIMACIEKGIGDEPDNYSKDAVDAANLGYCELFDFKCAGARTCDAWAAGGPITTEDVEDGSTE